MAILKKIFFNPIICWVPAELRRYNHFINTYCWVRGTYYATQTYEDHVFSFSPTKENLIYYYQWVPIFLLLQAGCFYAPYAIWYFLVQKFIDADLFSLIDAAKKLDKGVSDPSIYRKYIVSHLRLTYLNHESHEFMNRLRQASKTPDLDREYRYLNLFSSHTNLTYLKHRLSKCYTCLAYIFVKFLYFFITLSQIYITDLFIR